jgi:hypothetical protein
VVEQRQWRIRSVIEVVDGVGARVFALRASGLVTAEEYARVVRPALRDWVDDVGHLHALVILERDFAYEKHGDWGTAADGVLEWPQWRRLGVVTDSWWLRRMAPFAAAYVPGSVRAFSRRDLGHAVTWLGS